MWITIIYHKGLLLKYFIIIYVIELTCFWMKIRICFWLMSLTVKVSKFRDKRCFNCKDINAWYVLWINELLVYGIWFITMVQFMLNNLNEISLLLCLLRILHLIVIIDFVWILICLNNQFWSEYLNYLYRILTAKLSNS